MINGNYGIYNRIAGNDNYHRELMASFSVGY